MNENACLYTDENACSGYTEKRAFFWPYTMCQHHYDIRMTEYLASLAAWMVYYKEKGWA